LYVATTKNLTAQAIQMPRQELLFLSMPAYSPLPPFSLEVSLDIIRQSSGSHFDPMVTGLFLEQINLLHGEICHENEALLHKKLEECIEKYFK